MEDTLRKFTEEELEDIVWGDHPDFEEVTKEKIEDTDRWHNYFSKVVRNKNSGKFYDLSWRVGATEYQECDYAFVIFEVKPKEITQTVYIEVGKDA